ncbi:hypothetical protein P7C70_g6648, partial [Phenoliferia sp. Uapishka_3]
MFDIPKVVDVSFPYSPKGSDLDAKDEDTKAEEPREFPLLRVQTVVSKPRAGRPTTTRRELIAYYLYCVGVAIQAVLFLFLGTLADYGSWRPWITTLLTLWGIACNFGFLGAYTPENWQAAAVLYSMSKAPSLGDFDAVADKKSRAANVAYTGYLTYFTAAFVGLAKDTPAMQQAEKDLAVGTISEDEFRMKETLEQNHIGDFAYILGSLGNLIPLVLCLPIVYGLHADESTAQNNLTYAAMMAFVGGTELLLSLPWFFVEQKRPGRELPKGFNIFKLIAIQATTAAKVIVRLPMAALYIAAYFVLSDMLNTSVQIAYTLQYTVINYGTSVIVTSTMLSLFAS